MPTHILHHFKKVDPVLHRVAQQYNPQELFELPQYDNYFQRLCRAIAGQQLSVKAAATIWGRFEALFAGGNVTPQQVVKLPHQKLRSVGLSNAKAKYIQGIAQAILDEQVKLEQLDQLSNQEVVTQLIQLKGVGQWTAEMFLMFTLGREDVFSTGDLGLKRAIEQLYDLRDPSPEELIELAQRWSPYRTYACRVLWQSLDNQPK